MFYYEIGSSKNSNPNNTGLAALQSMMMGTTPGSSSSTRGSGNSNTASSSNPFAMQGASAKELLAQSQAFFNEHQKLLQTLPPNSVQRQTYEAILNEMKQAAEQKYAFHAHFL